MAVSDVLYEAVLAIRDYQREGVIATLDDPILEFLIRVMTAERVRRDSPPDMLSTDDFAWFEARIAAALDNVWQGAATAAAKRTRSRARRGCPNDR